MNGQDGVKHVLTLNREGSAPGRRSKRRRSEVENDAYTAFCRRAIRSAGRRVAGGDVDALSDLISLTGDLDAALDHAVTGLRAFGYSWAEIASRIGVTRQAAQQRWGSSAGGPR